MEDQATSYVEIPPGQLPPETYRRVLEEYINREGTDYGEQELSLEAKCDNLARQVDSGEVVILFDFTTSSCSLVTREEAQRLAAAVPESDDAP